LQLIKYPGGAVGDKKIVPIGTLSDYLASLLKAND
jgi:hypothetical protein